MIDEQRYNQRVRQAISDKYVEYSKMYADTHQAMLEVEVELRAKNAKKNLSYEQMAARKEKLSQPIQVLDKMETFNHCTFIVKMLQ